jgi:DNA-binding transcriptional ArsR family regulator
LVIAQAVLHEELKDLDTERNVMKAATDKLSLALRAIADPNRRKILRLLRTKGTHRPGEPSGLNASDIEQKVKLAQPTISHHMKILKKAGLIEIQKAGTWVWYRRAEGSLKNLRSNIQDEL